VFFKHPQYYFTQILLHLIFYGLYLCDLSGLYGCRKFVSRDGCLTVVTNATPVWHVFLDYIFNLNVVAMNFGAESKEKGKSQVAWSTAVGLLTRYNGNFK
jgi:hypothetical protein